MSEEKNLEEFELSDDAIESAAGGSKVRSPLFYTASFTCNNCGGNAVFQRQRPVQAEDHTHDCGEIYHIDFSYGVVKDSKNQGVANLNMSR